VTTTNITDITNMTDATLDIFLAAKADPTGTHDTDHLTETEQRVLYAALGVHVPTGYFESFAEKVEDPRSPGLRNKRRLLEIAQATATPHPHPQPRKGLVVMTGNQKYRKGENER